MNTEIIVALLSAGVAVISILFSTHATRVTAQLNYQQELEKGRASKEQVLEDLMNHYREPLLHAAFDLQSRIYNIVVQDFLLVYGRDGTEHEQAYARTNTLFVIGQYLAWIEIIRRGVQFLDLGGVERSRLFADKLEATTDALSTDRFARPFMIFRGYQRALGELLTDARSDPDGAVREQCVGYARFCDELQKDSQVAHWFKPLVTDVEAATMGLIQNWDRLIAVQHGLIDLIRFLDDPPKRFPRQRLDKIGS